MNPFEDAFNMVILGKTQSGKTAVAREAHATSGRDLSIWLNEQGKHRVPNVASEGSPVRSVDGLKAAMARDQRRINLVASDRNRAIVELQDWLWEVADRTDRELKMQLIVDEAHRVAPQSQKDYGNLPHRDAIRDFAKEGVKREIKLVSITQDPVAYDKQSLRQAEYRLVFDMSAENRSAVSDYGFRWDLVDAAPQYAGVLHAANGEPIDEAVKAAPRFA